MGLAPLPAVRLDLAATFMQHEYEQWRPSVEADFSGNEMELAPRFIGNARLTWRPAFLRSGAFSAEWVRLGSYYMDPENTHEYDGHDLINAQAAVPVGSGIEVVARVANIANARYAETSSFTQAQGERYRPGTPRQVYVGVQYQFGR